MVKAEQEGKKLAEDQRRAEIHRKREAERKRREDEKGRRAGSGRSILSLSGMDRGGSARQSLLPTRPRAGDLGTSGRSSTKNRRYDRSEGKDLL